MQDFLDLLVSMRFLERADQEGTEPIYSNSPDSQKFLVEGQPAYIGAYMTLSTTRLYPTWDHLEYCLRHGEIPPAARQRVPPADQLFTDTKFAVPFAMAMLSVSQGSCMAFVEKVDLSRYQSLGDFGGSTGCLCVAACRRHPHLTATTYDLPVLEDTAREYVRSRGCPTG